jgi:threonine dehydratase
MYEVTEDEIAAAILKLIEKQKLITEGAGAVSAAAVMFNKIPLKGKNVVCLLSGGNIDVNILSRVITRGLITSGRLTTFVIMLEDKPGQLVEVSQTIAEHGGNVVSVHYEGSDANMAISSCFLRLNVETKDFEQIDQISRALQDKGFQLVE